MESAENVGGRVRGLVEVDEEQPARLSSGSTKRIAEKTGGRQGKGCTNVLRNEIARWNCTGIPFNGPCAISFITEQQPSWAIALQ